MIDPRALRPVRLGAEAVRWLLPHRPPLLLVDGVNALATEPPALRATKHISVSEPVFGGHFPDRWIWPGVYTIEGLAQSCALLGALLEAARALEAAQPPLDLGALVALDRWPPGGAEDAQRLPHVVRSASTAVLAAVDVKLSRPVFAGQRVDYLVVRTHAVGPIHRFDVEATVDGQVAARGTLSTAIFEPP